MTEEIIIDGVDVSGCDRLRTFRDWTYSSDKWCGISNDGGCECEQNINCLYKQLRRLEQENKVNLSRAKDLNTELQRLTDENFNLKQTLEEIRKIADNVSDTFDTPMVLAVKIQNKINEVLE